MHSHSSSSPGGRTTEHEVRNDDYEHRQIIVQEESKGLQSHYSLKGEIAVVTGGGSGLGLAIASAITHCGGKVALVGRREQTLRDACKKLGAHCYALQLDVTSPDAADTINDKVTTALGAPSILVNNAGIHLKSSYRETTGDDFEKVLRTHVTASFLLSQKLGRGMEERGGGAILFITSMAAIFGIPLVTAYSAAKSSQAGIIRSLAVELSPSGVRVNGIAPGWIHTPMSHKALSDDPARKDRILSRTPMNRLGTAEEVGQVAAFLCSPAASFITGAILPVDGGVSIGF